MKRLLAVVDDAIVRSKGREEACMVTIRADIDHMRHLPRTCAVPRAVLRKQVEASLRECEDAVGGVQTLTHVRDRLRAAVSAG